MKNRKITIFYTPLSDQQIDQVDKGHSVFMQRQKLVKALGTVMTFILPVVDLRLIWRGIV